MVRKFLKTNDDIYLFVLRVVLGSIFLAHGLQKTFAWLGGPGQHAIMQWFAQQKMPLPLAWLAILTELVGGLAFGYRICYAHFRSGHCCKHAHRHHCDRGRTDPTGRRPVVAGSRVHAICSGSGEPIVSRGICLNTLLAWQLPKITTPLGHPFRWSLPMPGCARH